LAPLNAKVFLNPEKGEKKAPPDKKGEKPRIQGGKKRKKAQLGPTKKKALSFSNLCKEKEKEGPFYTKRKGSCRRRKKKHGQGTENLYRLLMNRRGKAGAWVFKARK